MPLAEEVKPEADPTVTDRRTIERLLRRDSDEMLCPDPGIANVTAGRGALRC
jgi:hypothetical protein